MRARRPILLILIAALVALGGTIATGWFWRGGDEPQAIPATGPTASGDLVENPFLPPGTVDPGWPQIRGPNYDGRSPEIHLANSWPSAGPPVLWTRPLGQGYSGWAAFGNRVFTQTQSLAGQFVICLDADTGETLWEHRYDWPFEAAGLYPGPRATPTYHAGRVYFSGPSGLIGCLSAEDGQPLWSVNLKEKYRGLGTDFGYSISPTVENGRVILPIGGKGASLVALDSEDGTVLWASGDAPASYTPALPITVEGERQLIALMENTLSAYDFDSGRLLWNIDLSQGYDEHSAWPLYAEPYLLIASPFRSGSVLYRLTGGPEATATVVRHSPVMSNDIFSSVLIAGKVYGFDLKDVQAKLHRPSRGTFRCLDLETGEQHWETGETGHTTVLEADGKLILFNDRGEVILARATPDKYEELARTSVLGSEVCWTQPTLHRGRLYLRNHTQAVCLYLGEPALLQQPAETPPMTVADIPQGEYQDLSVLMGVEPEYAFDVPSDEWLQTWYGFGLGILATAGVVTGLTRLLFRRLGEIGAWWLFWSLAFLLGAAGTTALSLARNDFTFTWPVCLFVSFQAVVYQSLWGAQKRVSRPRTWSYLTALLFLAVCGGYFLLCGRLSLVMEWAFLSGFITALPICIAAAYLTRGRWRLATSIVGTALGFTAFYWGGVLLLAWKY